MIKSPESLGSASYNAEQPYNDPYAAMSEEAGFEAFSGLYDSSKNLPVTTSGQQDGSELFKRPELKQAMYEERRQVAGEVLDARNRYNPIRSRLERDEAELFLLEQELTELNSKRYELASDIEQRLHQLSVRLKSIVNIPDKTVGSLESSVREVDTWIKQQVAEVERLRLGIQESQRLLDEITPPEDLLQAYKVHRETAPLTVADKKELLQSEFLSDISTKEYMALWRKLNPYFMAHVTRHGVKDKARFHVGGAGEFNDGAKAILESGKLTSLTGSESGLKQVADRAALYGSGPLTGDMVRAYLSDYGEPPIYADITSVHLSAQEVLDDLYGGESDNQAFFVFPADFIASQYTYTFHGYEGFASRPEGSEAKWNDTFVYDSNGGDVGIPLDSGLTFLPKSTLVDPVTGSKYALEQGVSPSGVESLVPSVDEGLVLQLQEWLRDSSTRDKILTIYEEVERSSRYIGREEIKGHEFAERCSKLLDPFIESKADRRQIAYQIYYSYDRWSETLDLNKIDIEKMAYGGEWDESSIFWKKAENRVRAEDYWESYFLQNPEQRPKHVVYYDGEPTQAVNDFLMAHEIYPKALGEDEDKFLGFEENHRPEYYSDPRIFAGIDAVATKIEAAAIKN